MKQLLKPWQLFVTAALILAGACSGADLARAQNQDQQLQKLMDDLFKATLVGEKNQATPDSSAKLQDLFRGLMRAQGAKDEQGLAEACMMPLLIPTFPGQSKAETPEQQTKADELNQYFSTAIPLMTKQEWEKLIEINQKALDLEKEIKTWPLAIPRELFLGEAWSHRGVAYRVRQQGDRAENIERAIEAQKNALEAYDRGVKSAALTQECSFVMATIRVNLGGAYGLRVRGEAAENQELAIAAHEQALTALSRETTPQSWAMAQNNLAAAYLARIRGKRAENIERAIARLEETLQVWTRQDFPAAWAGVQNNLSSAHLKRIRGNRADNIERAIEASANSLTVRSREYPTGEAPIKNPYADLLKESQEGLDKLGMSSLGKSLSDAMDLTLNAEAKGSRAAVVLPTAGWAQSQSNLGEAYLNRINGDRADNVERAITAYEAALTLMGADAVQSG
jgi:hypothetical protein